MSNAISTAMTSLADQVREISGTEGKKSIINMTQDLDSANDEVEEQARLISLLTDKVSGLPSVGETPSITLQNKTVNSSTVLQTINADVGYDGLETVTINPISIVEQATPSIGVGADGIITVTAAQTAGYVEAGTKTTTKQLSTQGSKTITPTTSQQTAVASGKYTTGNITVKGDSNLVANNIKKGVSIFGVSGAFNGADISDATATANDIMLGQTAYIANGKATGTFTIQEEISSINTKLDEIDELLDEKASSGGSGSTGNLVTVNVYVDSPVDPEDLLYYVNENGGLSYLELATVPFGSSASFQCVAPSIVYNGGFSNISQSVNPDLNIISSTGTDNVGKAVYITESCTIKFM